MALVGDADVEVGDAWGNWRKIPGRRIGFSYLGMREEKGLRSRGEVVASIDLEMDVLRRFIADKSSLKMKFSIQRLSHRP